MADFSSGGGQNSDGFINRALDSVPNWALAIIGILFAITIFLAFSGLNAPITRVANAYATRIERAVENLESLSKSVNAINAKIDANHKEVMTEISGLKSRVTAIEKENKEYHNRK